MRLFLVVRPEKAVIDQISQTFDSFKMRYPIFEWEAEENILVPVVILKDYPENKLELIEEAVEQSIFDITPTMLFFDQFKFLQKNGQLLLLARFHREKKLEEIRNRMAHYCLSEKENDIDKPYEPFITLASAKLPSKQQYLHLKKKIERLNPEIEIRADKLEMVSFIEEQASSRYDKIATFELAE